MTSAWASSMLMDECGLGKTRTYTLALLLRLRHLEQLVEQEKAGLAEPPDGGRVFRPSCLFVPASVVNQTFRELTALVPPEQLDIAVCHGNRFRVDDQVQQNATLATSAELQAWVDTCRQESGQIRTSRKLLLMSYTTAIARILPTRGKGGGQTGGEEEDEEVDLDDDGPGDDSAAPASASKGKATAGSSPWQVTDFNFDWMILDEGHAIKNPASFAHYLISRMPNEAIMFVSATPLLNQLKDMLGYLRLIWRPQWGFTYPLTPGEDGDVDDWFSAEVLGNLRDGNDGNAIVTRERLGARDGADADGPGGAVLRALRDSGAPMYMLHPGLFERWGARHGWGARAAQFGVRCIMSFLAVRRRMGSEITLPDSTTVSPGKDVPPAVIRTVVVRPELADVVTLRRIIGLHIDMLEDDGDGGDAPIRRAPGRRDGLDNPQFSSVQRVLSLASTSHKFYLLTQPSERNVKLLLDLDAAKAMQTTVMGGKALASSSGGGARAGRGRSGSHAVAGVDEMNAIVERDRTGGLHWYHMLTRPDGSSRCPTSRITMAQSICFCSPKLSYAVSRTLRLSVEGERVLIYCYYPLTQM